MNAFEAERVFQLLSKAMESAGLTWLVEEALQEIRQGKPQQKRLKLQPSQEVLFPGDEPETEKGRQATFVESVEFSSLERLTMLLSAIERGVVQPAEMENRVAFLLAKASQEKSTSKVLLRPANFKFISEDGKQIHESAFPRRLQLKEISKSLANTVARFQEVLHASD